MAQTAIRDVVIWAKHIHGDAELVARVAALKGGETIELLVDGVQGTWRKMDDGRDGRPTTGIRPIGRMQDFWRELYAARRGDVVPIETPEAKAAPMIYPALAKTPEERRAALAALLAHARESGLRSNGLVITRDDMHDRALDREGL